MKIGLIFAGQGAQYTGMGKELYDYSRKAKEVMDLAGEQVKEWCFEGTKEMLRQTHITQPCVYTVTMAAYEALMEEIEKQDASLFDSIEIEGLAGFSLGEYAALTAAGTINDIRKGMDIVTKRGTWMNEAGLGEDGVQRGSMVAAFGARQEILDCVADVKEDGILQGVNFNSPVQTVVAGDKESLERFKAEAKARKIKAIPLSVGTAFHSEMMEPAATKLQNLLMECELKAPNKRVYSDVTAEDMMKGTEEMDEAGVSRFIAELMGKQAMSPVYWQEIIENMVADGVECVIEIGPGTTLCGIVKKIKHDMITLNVQDMESLQHTVKTLIENK
ncbi:ACP S-malonyltransferase [Aminipila terrae]|uniref:Malonyl CoA-acyl carrier protein transacylase n=1 Tax=Aminipila terrae TaxID=2697030 RepID=A0A6P1MIX4_9FIRM|nr:ACP S-malonyltransferase [Aminipila terrae]QHI72564.1 acyltransferase domain-containing protein [Aminipila terrae]